LPQGGIPFGLPGSEFRRLDLDLLLVSADLCLSGIEIHASGVEVGLPGVEIFLSGSDFGDTGFQGSLTGLKVRFQGGESRLCVGQLAAEGLALALAGVEFPLTFRGLVSARLKRRLLRLQLADQPADFLRLGLQFGFAGIECRSAESDLLGVLSGLRLTGVELLLPRSDLGGAGLRLPHFEFRVPGVKIHLRRGDLGGTGLEGDLSGLQFRFEGGESRLRIGQFASKGLALVLAGVEFPLTFRDPTLRLQSNAQLRRGPGRYAGFEHLQFQRTDGKTIPWREQGDLKRLAIEPCLRAALPDDRFARLAKNRAVDGTDAAGAYSQGAGGIRANRASARPEPNRLPPPTGSRNPQHQFAGCGI